MDGEAAVRLEAQEEELAGLVGGEGEADAFLGEPGGEVAGRLDPEGGGLGSRRLGGWLVHGAVIRAGRANRPFGAGAAGFT